MGFTNCEITIEGENPWRAYYAPLLPEETAEIGDPRYFHALVSIEGEPEEGRSVRVVLDAEERGEKAGEVYDVIRVDRVVVLRFRPESVRESQSNGSP